MTEIFNLLDIDLKEFGYNVALLPESHETDGSEIEIKQSQLLTSIKDKPGITSWGGYITTTYILCSRYICIPIFNLKVKNFVMFSQQLEIVGWHFSNFVHNVHYSTKIQPPAAAMLYNIVMLNF